jgi:hypothetical protein
MQIHNEAGKLRGVRVMRDPSSLLLSTFTGTDGIQYGYVVVPSEESPAVFDGKEWHSILKDEIEDWTTFSMTKAQEQFVAMQSYATIPEYQSIMNSLYGMAAA